MTHGEMLDRLRAAGIDPVVEREALLGCVGWKELNPDHSVYAWEAPILWLWHRMWKAPMPGYYDQATDWWRVLTEEGWIGVGIFPSHYALPPDPPEELNSDAKAGQP